MADAVRKVDIAHSGQTVVEAMEQLKVEVKKARRDRETVLLVVHGFGASGVGGAIKAALSTELPRLARQHGFKTYGYGASWSKLVQTSERKSRPGNRPRAR